MTTTNGRLGMDEVNGLAYLAKRKNINDESVMLFVTMDRTICDRLLPNIAFAIVAITNGKEELVTSFDMII